MRHIPVLLGEVTSVFSATGPHHCVVDATLGLGGHASVFCQTLGKNDIFIGFDRDRQNLEDAQRNIQSINAVSKQHYIHASFDTLKISLDQIGISKIDFILYDLGVSSAHYDEGDRGFSFRFDAPLDMRFDRNSGKTVHDLVMSLSEYELRNIMFRYADEKKAVHIARAIVEARATHSIDTTYHLLDIIRASSYDKDSPKRVFQALRIAVNDEFSHIERSLGQAVSLLETGGIIAVITFHSLEDRIVKNIFSSYLLGTIDDITGQTIIPPILKKYTKKPIEPTVEEIQNNPRSRSAKLRIYQKT